MKLIVAALAFASLTARAEFRTPSSDFRTLFNAHRFGQAAVLPWPGSYWPYYAERGAKPGINHVPPGQELSPAQKYDRFFGTNGAAEKWENQNHTCEGETASALRDCKTWYGHCNGWTGAALFNPEPDYDRPVRAVSPATGEAMEFNHMDLKALLSEAWLDVWASFEGTGMSEKPGAWIFDPEAPKAKAKADNNRELTNYEAYWDVTPRAFFYLLMNYVGVRKEGLAIERFTGSEIWNQPLVAYRFLPIAPPGPPVERRGRQVYPVTIGLKIYWASDDVDYTFRRTASLGWNVADERFSNDRVPARPAAEEDQDKVADEAIISRFLSFTFFFDAPVTVSADGTQVLSAGRMLGDGVWTHADPELKQVWYAQGYEKSQVHPDFVWRPDRLVDASFRNPAIDPAKIYKHILQKPMEEFAPRQ